MQPTCGVAEGCAVPSALLKPGGLSQITALLTGPLLLSAPQFPAAAATGD